MTAVTTPPGVLIEYPDLEQGTEEWHDVRRGIVTASTIGQLITTKTMKPASNDTSRGLTAQLVAERITGWTDPTYVSDDMMRGHMDEPLARDLYAETYAPVTEMGFLIRRAPGIVLGYSPDGLVGDDGLLEIKSRRPKKHLATILANEVPTENMAQIQAGLLVSGRAWCDYISYCGGMPMWTKRVHPDERWFDAITAAVTWFEEAARQHTDTYQKAIAGLPATERINYDDILNAELTL